VAFAGRGVHRHFISICVAAAALAGLALLAAPAQGSSGTFERAWGLNVAGGGVFGVCADAPTCLAGTSSPLPGAFALPQSVAVDADGNVYVADHGNDRLQKFAPSGQLERMWGRDVISGGPDGAEICIPPGDVCKAGIASNSRGEFFSPSGVDVGPDGKIYTTDGDRVQRFNADGGFELMWGRDVVAPGTPGDVGPINFEICPTHPDDVCQGADPGGLAGDLSIPDGISVSGEGVFVADQTNNRIAVYNHSGAFQRSWGKDVVASGTGETPGDGLEFCVPVFSTCKAGEPGTLGGELDGPRDVEAGAGGVYVADSDNDRIQRYDSTGGFQRAWGRDVLSGAPTDVTETCVDAAMCKKALEGTEGGEFSIPSGLASDDSGDVYVADLAAHRIQRFNSDGVFEAAWGKNVNGGGVLGTCTVPASCLAGQIGGLGGELRSPYGLDAAADGTVYVADRPNNRVQVFAKDPPVVDPPTDPPGVKPPPPSTGKRAAALRKCKKAAKKKRWSKKRLRKCKRKALKLPV
jgi:DNA-binding beta-propeller fold protein YncE